MKPGMPGQRVCFSVVSEELYTPERKIKKESSFMYKSFSMELAGRTLTVDVDRVAKQANGAAFMHYGDTVVLSTVCSRKDSGRL